jgi:endonuclease/exonuclease/phosphatase (EEP) superfamily protein YafD
VVSRRLTGLRLPQGEFAPALRGAVLACAAALGAAALLGMVGSGVANQTLLSNATVHAAALACALGVGLAAAGWRLMGSAGAALAAFVAWQGFERGVWTEVGPAAAEAPRLELLHFNVLYDNERARDAAAAIAGSGADVVVLLEASGVAEHFDALAAIYPHRFGCDGVQCEIAVLSRLPLRDAAWLAFPHASLDRLARVVLDVEGRDVTLFAAHFAKDYFASFRSDQAWRLTGEVRRWRRSNDGPVVVAADFNAAPWDPIVRRTAYLTRLASPRGWLPTWPAAAGPFGLPIDGLMVSDDLRVERIATTPEGFGSNHRGLRATLALAP